MLAQHGTAATSGMTYSCQMLQRDSHDDSTILHRQLLKEGLCVEGLLGKWAGG